uniref:Uncharacterized protein n=1 Tax=Trichuris muris TaxID=70415 RepID=A0A5S6QEY1_TRIMR
MISIHINLDTDGAMGTTNWTLWFPIDHCVKDDPTFGDWTVDWTPSWTTCSNAIGSAPSVVLTWTGDSALGRFTLWDDDAEMMGFVASDASAAIPPRSVFLCAWSIISFLMSQTQASNIVESPFLGRKTYLFWTQQVPFLSNVFESMPSSCAVRGSAVRLEPVSHCEKKPSTSLDHGQGGTIAGYTFFLQTIRYASSLTQALRSQDFVRWYRCGAPGAWLYLPVPPGWSGASYRLGPPNRLDWQSSSFQYC